MECMYWHPNILKKFKCYVSPAIEHMQSIHNRIDF